MKLPHIDSNVVEKQLKDLRIHQMLDWIKDFLNDQSQFVNYNNTVHLLLEICY